LDYHLDQLGIIKNKVKGYEQEEFTHLAVAAAVVSGRADCGLGITAAASALDCDFIPLFNEQYELVIPAEYLQNEMFQLFFEVAHDPLFRQRIKEMPGYEVGQMGEIRTIIP
jgi:putative molybdopterin biosynthesis protein